jgi:hypothetical protein
VSAPETPRFLVCEDGHEYTERFVRLLGGAFRFERAGCFAEAEAATAAAAFAGLLLDLDFRRTPPDRLIDENGAGTAATEETRRRLAEVQGILILRALRVGGRTQPALLFADIDDAEQVRYLERTLAPLHVVSSRTALPEIARLLGRISGRTEPSPPA